jgi:hypothetical protein
MSGESAVAPNQHKIANQKKDFSHKSEKCHQLSEQRFSLFCDVTEYGLVVTDVSGQYICPEKSLSANLRRVTSQKS